MLAANRGFQTVNNTMNSRRKFSFEPTRRRTTQRILHDFHLLVFGGRILSMYCLNDKAKSINMYIIFEYVELLTDKVQETT